MKKEKILIEFQKSLALSFVFFVGNVWLNHFDSAYEISRTEFMRHFWFSLLFGFGFVGILLLSQHKMFKQKTK